jgi:acetyl esterase
MEPAHVALLAGRLATAVRGRAIRAAFRLPPPVVRRLAGTADARATDLDPEALLLARLWSRPSRPVALPEQRRRFDLTIGAMSARPSVAPHQQDLAIQAGSAVLRGRLYTPTAACRAPGPLLVYFHGGGWTRGSIESHHGACRLFAHLTGVRLLLVGYRLAPENPYPAALDDAFGAYAWAVRHADELGADAKRIAVGGDSAGGTLAAVTARLARDDASLPSAAFQLLIYPLADLTSDTASRLRYAEGFFLTKERIESFTEQYIPDASRRADPNVSPLLADELSGLPPAHIATATADPLRDEGEAYALRLREAGVPISLQRHDQIHGFFNTTALRSSRDAVAQMAAAVRQGLSLMSPGVAASPESSATRVHHQTAADPAVEHVTGDVEDLG